MTRSRSPQSPGAKMQYLIKRRATTSREELIAHWFANHMPGVIARNEQAQAAGTAHARHYVATLFDPAGDAPQVWDGVAQLWYDAALERPPQASGAVPSDTFHEKVEPYWPWATHEWVVIDGKLPLTPPTLNASFPCTRSGFLKQTSLVAAKPGADINAMLDHWLDTHVPNVQTTMAKVGGFRYVVSLSIDLDNAPYAGMAELYFPDRAVQTAFWEELLPDGFQQWADPVRTLRFRSGTEMVGVE
jgi:hypothetical protein